MGTASIVFGILGICICWVPGLGWIGVPLGVLGCVFGIPSITHWFYKPGYTPWGISALVLGVTAADLSTAYQIKYAQGALDGAFFSIGPLLAAGICASAIAICALGLVIARKKNRPFGIFLTSSALAGLIVVSTAALITADRQYEAEVVAQVSSD